MLPSSPLANALQRCHGLDVFLEDPEVSIDTNHLERALRPVPMGKRNRLFASTEVGARRVGIIQSLFVTCTMHAVDPCTYLVDVLHRIGGHPAKRVGELAPRVWKSLFAHDPLPSALGHQNLDPPHRAPDDRNGPDCPLAPIPPSRDRRRRGVPAVLGAVREVKLIRLCGALHRRINFSASAWRGPDILWRKIYDDDFGTGASGPATGGLRDAGDPSVRRRAFRAIEDGAPRAGAGPAAVRDRAPRPRAGNRRSRKIPARRPRRPMAPPPGDAALPAARCARVGAPPGRRPGRRTAPGRGARHAEAGRRRERTGPGGPANRGGKGADSAPNHTIYPPFRGFSPPMGGRQGAAWRLECPLPHIAGCVATGRRADGRNTVASIRRRATGKRRA